ncbi:MAG: Stk1 family PASTA domain-containing Ser/Thr kinase [Lachnospiraceae bacterium]|nr:Stk1 family PASTA domain-containing Ser/Thr kinase [Lachnospiraceae bacterium]
MGMIKPGMFIGDRYEIIDKIGSGGMADVYKAKCHRLNRFVAIKILKPEFSADESFVSKFRGEAQSCAGLTHPNIVSVFDVGDDGDLHYIVMELVEGITLKRFIERKGRLDVKEAVGIAIQIAMGLDVAHQNHVVHRDIKPQNIIISKEGKVKVADFGIARAVSTTTTINNYSQNIGSVHYLSPEQARGVFSDERSDIYSLGVTLYEMLAGHVPFTGDNAVSVALLHVHGEAEPLSKVNPTVPPSVEKIVEKCMQKKPDRRYMTTAELIQDLKAAIVRPDGDFVKIVSSEGSATKFITPGELKEINAEVAVHSDAFDDEDDVEEEEANRQKAAVTAAAKRRKREEEEDDDDDDLDSMGNNTEKFFVALSICFVIAVAVGAIVLISKIVSGGFKFPEPKGLILTPTSTPTPKPSTTPTPKQENMKNYKGQDYNVVVEKLYALDLHLNIRYDPADQYYEDYPVNGQVVSQSPAAGEPLEDGMEVHLIYSIGKEQITIGNYKGLSEAEVRSALDNKLSVRVDWQESDTVPENKVIDTNPKAGEQLPVGSTLIIILSQGNSRVTTVPNVVGMKEVDAKATLIAAKLNYTSERQYSDTVPEGVVISQSPASSSEKVEKGSIIKLVVSGGIEPTPTPTPTPEPTPTPVPATPTPVPPPPEGGDAGNGGAGGGEGA